ncbi:dimethyladenosine transferase 1, mitochondrial [Venturia canescens]|uniref:dimethyladenosine transferase 1, mitochondrial n=1 Tax=Venturia canescens TaxID=32260 RepID=UPI001C9C5108|nr:dimethyladenosine transferase 1, mitochondrial [Venturia canescens]
MASGVLRLPPLPTIRDLIKLYRISARKQLSQNFLMDENLTSKIIKQAGHLTNGHVIEVGPGPGGLTRAVLRKMPKKLIVVEKDKRFNPTLKMLGEAFSNAGGQMNIISDDILRTNFDKMIDEKEKVRWEARCPNITVIGNLPFSVSTHLIIRWLESISRHEGLWSFGRTRLLLTFQKEVAERLVAPVKNCQRCRLSVMAQAWTQPKLRFLIPGTAFVPKPKVDVGVVSFIPLITPRTTHDFKLFEKVTRHVFSFRRKFSIKGVATLFPPENREELSIVMFKIADVDPQARPYELSVEDIHRLCSSYKYLREKHPSISDYEYRASKKIMSRKYLQNVEVVEFDDYADDELEESNDRADTEINEQSIENPLCTLNSPSTID